MAVSVDDKGYFVNAERWRQVDTILQKALETAASDRATFLDGACAGNLSLRSEVEALIRSYEQADSFLESPLISPAADRGYNEPVVSLEGQTLGHYVLKRLLGSGGMGEVYLAEDKRLGRPVAIKLLPAECTADPERVRRFAQEARSASALNHPNIVTIYEINDLDNTHYIVTEYVEGETLRQRMDCGSRMKVRDALDFALQVASALEAAHRSGIVHRDIKPENVMVRPDGLVKVLDFGLAKLLEPSIASLDARLPIQNAVNTESGVVMGTPRCMSPEQARGEKADARADIFSLGVLLYEMASCQPPFTGTTRNEVIASVLKDEPPPLAEAAPGMPHELGRIIHRALQKQREDRYQFISELLADLKSLRRDLELEVEAKRPSQGSEDRKAPAAPGSASLLRLISLDGSVANKRRRAIVVLAALALTGVGFFHYFNRQPALAARDTILLADFENKTGDSIFDVTLRQGLAMQLEQSPFLNLFPEARMQHSLQLMGRSPQNRVTVEVAREICERQNLKAFIAGSIAPLGSHYVIMLEAINGQSGDVLARSQVESGSKEQVLRALSQAAKKLREKLGESLSSVQRFDKAFEDATTSQLEAFKFYSQGAQQAISGRQMEAIPLLKRAVELDPDFAYAYSLLGATYGSSGQLAVAARYAEKAYALRDRVGEYEKLRIAYWYHRHSTGDLHKGIESLTLQEQMYPGKWAGGPADLAISYLQIGEFRKAVERAREAVRILPEFGPAQNALAGALLRLDRFAEAREVLTRALQLGLDSTGFHFNLFQIASINNDTAAMQDQVNWASGRPDEYVGLDWQTRAAAFAGEWRKAQDLSRRAIDLASRGDAKEVAARYAAEQALRNAVLGDCRLAGVNAEKGATIEGGRASLPVDALALALCGDTTRAKPLILESSKRYPHDTVIHSIWVPAICAAMELQGGNATQAVEQLTTASGYEAAAEFWPQYLRGQARLRLKEGAEAAMEFRKILEHRGQGPLSVLYPLAHLGLARAEALVGDQVKSLAAYEEFFKLWKTADPDLRVLRQANTEYKRIKQIQVGSNMNHFR